MEKNQNEKIIQSRNENANLWTKVFLGGIDKEQQEANAIH
jgi:hypothetical protein